MGQYLIIGAAAAGVAILLGLSGGVPQAEPQKTVSVSLSPHVSSGLVATSVEEVGTTGEALAAAAFGMSALEPETYNGELVVHLIEASPLEDTIKDDLVAELEAAEAGQADLNDVLADVRVALAVD